MEVMDCHSEGEHELAAEESHLQALGTTRKLREAGGNEMNSAA